MHQINMPGSRTGLCALFGNPVGHSLSPRLHNRAFAAAGIDNVYLAFAVEDPAAAVAAVRTLGIAGCSVTIPHKQTIMKHLDRLAPEAVAAGAVNTIVNRDGVLSGCNTDATGLIRVLRQAAVPVDRPALLLGAGGVSRAALYALLAYGFTEVAVWNRTAAKAVQLVEHFERSHPQQVIRAIHGERELAGTAAAAGLLINGTSVGMVPDTVQTPFGREYLHPQMTVMDLVYTPQSTRLLQESRAAGCRILTGDLLFLHQALEQFELWTGKKAPVAEMTDELNAALGYDNADK